MNQLLQVKRPADDTRFGFPYHDAGRFDLREKIINRYAVKPTTAPGTAQVPALTIVVRCKPKETSV